MGDEGNVAYVCDRELPCRYSVGCAANGGECSHTADVAHAANFVLLASARGSRWMERIFHERGDDGGDRHV